MAVGGGRVARVLLWMRTLARCQGGAFCDCLLERAIPTAR
jgi:hypothetical protein